MCANFRRRKSRIESVLPFSFAKIICSTRSEKKAKQVIMNYQLTKLRISKQYKASNQIQNFCSLDKFGFLPCSYPQKLKKKRCA